MTLVVQYCPTCGIQAPIVTLTVGDSVVFAPCGHAFTLGGEGWDPETGRLEVLRWLEQNGGEHWAGYYRDATEDPE